MTEPLRLPIEGADDPWAALWVSFERHLRAEGRNPKTLVAYRKAGADFHSWLHEHNSPCDPAQVRREHAESWLIDLRERRQAKPATIRLRYAALHRFFGFLLEEEEITHSPLERVKAPRVEEEPPALLTDEELAALLRACAGRDFLARRDAAIIRTMVDTGLRRAELLGIKLDDDLDLGSQTIQVVRGKGGRPRLAFFGVRTARDLDRYIRVRARHPQASSPYLWLPASRGGEQLGDDGLAQMLIRRATAAGLEGRVRPHGMRHYFAHALKDAGASDEDTMTLGGWRDPKIMRRYGASMAQARAREAHRRLSPGDRV